jgi:2-polyprenyl-3-methyl-5-hydroxy-6-metoxy-1,4-benzoquinol methylase
MGHDLASDAAPTRARMDGPTGSGRIGPSPGAGGAARLHRIRRTAAPLGKAVCDVARRSPVPVSVLDVACGGGDVLVRLARQGRSAGLKMHLAGCDLRPVALGYARRQAEAAGVPEIRFFAIDVLHQPLPQSYDIVLCTLFLHHLDEPEAVALLQAMGRSARQLVLVEDLCRSRLGWILTWLGCRLVSRSPIVHVDGPRSVRAAYTPDEALALANRAGLDDARMTRHWPQRFVLQWRRR